MSPFAYLQPQEGLPSAFVEGVPQQADLAEGSQQVSCSLGEQQAEIGVLEALFCSCSV